MPQGMARTPTGSISVVTTASGLPTALKIDPRELKKAPRQLADEILALCRLSAMRGQVAHRRDMVEQGYSSSTISVMNLATEEQLVKTEEEMFGDEDLPDSWMRSV